MIGWLIFAVVVIAMVGWRVVGFFRRSRFSQREVLRKITVPPTAGQQVDRDYEEYYSDPETRRSLEQIREEFKMMMHW